jgi:tol-pal system protein YbgF
MARAPVALAVLALLATGCASRASLRQIQEEVMALRRAHEATLREPTTMKDQLRALDARNVQLQAEVAEQSASVARLRARLDSAEQALQQAKASAVRQPDSPEPDDALRAYDAAMASFRAREHGQAVLELLDFIARYPAHPLAASAQYWVGEAYYVQRDYRQALVEFQRVVEMAPSSPAAADALLRIGLAHTNLRENSRAQQAWQRVVREYPATESAGKARTLLREHSARRP